MTSRRAARGRHGLQTGSLGFLRALAEAQGWRRRSRLRVLKLVHDEAPVGRNLEPEQDSETVGLARRGGRPTGMAIPGP